MHVTRNQTAAPRQTSYQLVIPTSPPATPSRIFFYINIYINTYNDTKHIEPILRSPRINRLNMTTPSTPIPAAIFGATGLTGSHALAALLASPSTWGPVHTISRRAPANPTSASTLASQLEPDTSKWAAALGATQPAPRVVLSAVGTTRAAAGGIAEQWKIDHDLNVELARAAKEAGASTYVFVSSGGTRGFAASSSPYARMKNGVEDTIRDLGFDHAVILKPGLIMGQREKARTVEGALQAAVGLLGRLSPGAKDAVSQDADVIGRAAVKAAQLAEEGKAPEKFWLLGPAEIVKLGREE